MNVAFYAPLKAPTHPVPSGDRSMGRALMAALQAAGCDVTMASDLRLYDGNGDAGTQDRLMDAARSEVDRLRALPAAPAWQAWITYHNYYKAPDLIGPAVAAALNIPYLQIESTRASKRLQGAWARFAQAAEHASDAAHTILYFTQHDALTLRRDAPEGQALVHLPPFLPRATLPEPSPLTGRMLSVGMMRKGDKLASYTLIAQTLAALPGTLDWSLDVVGDGEAAADVRRLLAPFGDRIRFHGALDAMPLSDLYRQASLFLWPGVNEAFGMVYLEAQAAGLPVVAQDRPGVRDVVTGPCPAPEAGPEALAQRLHVLLTDSNARHAASTAARTGIAQSHLLPHAAATLRHVIEGLFA
ncbi:MAG: glycosyltransferase family 4 protein [Pseudomonadota bacterium]